MSEPLPLAKIIHTLTNEPWCWTPDEVMDCPLAMLAIIWTKQKETPAYTVQDARRDYDRVQRRIKLERGGVAWDAPAFGDPGAI